MDKRIEMNESAAAFQGFFQIRRLKFRHSLYQGGMTPEIEREVFGRGEASVVLLYDSQAREVVLIEQCRAGAVERAIRENNLNNAWLLEPVAGMIDLGETPLEAGIREVREEAGLEVSDLEYISKFYPSPGGSDEILHLFAVDIDVRLLPEFSGLEEDHEDIKIIRLDFEEAKRLMLEGCFNVATTYIALQWLFFRKLID
ncbi:NUDIX domain-containing protein [Thiomicrorhabdus sp.]|uniref:NUDIX domain-containing protein n=1 Tax=Thiomicrorhabdus sp. TaxID=2039724 RepID=UPI0029C755A7|nr:NUDIX domain-containing protein [Thiomicrorhabdus sp.]